MLGWPMIFRVCSKLGGSCVCYCWYGWEIELGLFVVWFGWEIEDLTWVCLFEDCVLAFDFLSLYEFFKFVWIFCVCVLDKEFVFLCVVDKEELKSKLMCF